MKIAVSSSGQDLESLVDPRFGRSAYFLIVESETTQFEAVSNPNLSAMHGAGIQTAQLMAGKGVKTVLTGNCGPNAFQTLSAAGIQVIVGVTGTVKDALERYKKGEFQPSSQASVPGHFGAGATGPTPGITPGTGAFLGGGGGGDMGRGRGGRGRGGGGGMGGTRPGAGPGGQCVCPACGATVPHQAGQPCYQVTCPKCGARMIRK